MQFAKWSAMWFAIFMSPVFAHAQGGIPAATLTKLKAATVFIKVESLNRSQTGSGFVIEREGTEGVVVTNAHVVRTRQNATSKINCMFNSGSSDEFGARATIVGIDDANDLAVLKVSHERLPEPLDIVSEVEVRETLPVLILGFPFGRFLATSSRSPSITISKGTVSSIRTDDAGRTAFLQIDGDINPGNSGGPIVTESGALVGISVATLTGTQIGLAIPKQQLKEMLLGRVAAVTWAFDRRVGKKAEFNTSVALIDPKQNLDEVSILTVNQHGVSAKATPDEDTRWKAVAENMVVTPLKMKGSVAHGKVALEIAKESSKYLFQLRFTRSDGRVFLTAPAEFDAASGSIPKPNSVVKHSPRGNATTSEPKSLSEREDVLRVLELPGTVTSVVAGGGGRFLMLQIDLEEQIVVFDVREKKIVLTIPAPSDALCAACQEEAFVVTPFDNQITRWSLKTMEKVSTKPLPIDGSVKAVAMGSASTGPMLIHWAEGSGALDAAHFSLMNIDTYQIERINRARYSRDETEKEATKRVHFRNGTSVRETVYIRASANGEAFGFWSTSGSPRGMQTLVLGSKPRTFYEHDTVGHIAPTADGKKICTARGLYGVDLVRNFRTTPCVPTYDAKYHIAVTENDMQVKDSSNGQTVVSIPNVDKKLTDSREMMYGRHGSRLSFDQRIHCVPDEGVLVSILSGDSTLVVQDVPLKTSPRPNQPQGDKQPAEEENEVRQWKDETGQFAITARLTAVEGSKVRLTTPDGRELSVAINTLSNGDVEYVISHRKNDR